MRSMRLLSNVQLLAKVFLLRRPKIGIWWVAVFLLGSLEPLDWIRKYLRTLNEKNGQGSLSPPDVTMSHWTASKQSFLDEEGPPVKAETSHRVPRSQLIRCRYNCKLQDSAAALPAWAPSGSVNMENVELELWPYLQSGANRLYQYFTWYWEDCPKQQSRSFRSYNTEHSYGFHHDTGRGRQDVADDLLFHHSEVKCQDSCRHNVGLTPSKESTLCVLHYLVEDVSGSRSWSNTTLPYLERHPWLEEWEGLSGLNEVSLPSVAQTSGKQLTWQLIKWLEDDDEGTS
ncbi:hypothetical protein JX266_014095 [Neoarthrinium moseri]|nr:hypothetical protein JX266_014095 [Neoarthrinium moseri]